MPSSVQLYTQAIADFKRLQDQLTKQQAKIGAESKADTFAELGNDLTNVQGFKLAIERSDRFISSIKDSQRKNDLIFQSLQQIIDQAIQFKQNLAIENSSATGNVNDLQAQANSTLDNIRGSLNQKDGANFLFSGSKTNIEPVSDLKFSTNYIDGTATASYYNGDDFKATVDVSSSQRVVYGVNASDVGFQKLIAAINLAKNTERSGVGNYAQAGSLLDSAIGDLTTLQAKIGDNANVFQNSSDYHDKAQTAFQEKYDEANMPDIVQLTIQTSQTQATLQASFMAFSKISALSLINYL